MLMETYLRMNEARERWLNAKKAFEEFRDSFQQGIDDEEEMVAYMEAMDYAEDLYNMYRLEYDSILGDEYHYDKDIGFVEPFLKKHGMEELYAMAAEAKQRYDDLAHDRIPFVGSWQDKKSELERLKYFYERTLAEYDLEKAQHLYDEKCDEHEEMMQHPVAPPPKRQPTEKSTEITVQEEDLETLVDKRGIHLLLNGPAKEPPRQERVDDEEDDDYLF